jgi:hypothetical protein
MKGFLWIVLAILVTALLAWVITLPGIPPDYLAILFFALFSVGPLGAFWMLYMAIRYEKHPLPLILLAFLPYSFLWYYFERVRPRKQTSRLAE